MTAVSALVIEFSSLLASLPRRRALARPGSAASGGRRCARPSPPPSRPFGSPLVLALVLAFAAGCSAPEEAPATLTAPPVEAVPARTGSLPLVERLSGTVRAENQVALYPEIGGRVAEVLVNDGQPVEAGQALVRLQDDAVREQVRQAEAGLRIQRARLRQARAELAEVEAQERRMRTLGERNLVSEVDLETLAARRESAAADVELAEAQVEQAESSLAERREDLARTVVRAPVAGAVGERDAEVGMQVGPSNRLFVIGNLDRVSVRVNLSDTMLRYLREGQPVRIYPFDTSDRRAGAGPGAALEDATLPATLTRISPFLDEVTRSTVAEIELANPGHRLRPGMFVPVDILYGESRRATLVPSSALYTDPNTGSEGVFVLASPPATATASPTTPATPPPAAPTAAALAPPVPVEFRPIVAVARGAEEVAVANVNPDEWVVTLGQNLLATGRSEARARAVTWEHVRELQGLKRQELLAEVLRATGGGETPSAPGAPAPATATTTTN